MRFSVAHIEAEVRALKLRGVQFEQFDFPGFDKATSIAWVIDHSAAWFKDSEGNLAPRPPDSADKQRIGFAGTTVTRRTLAEDVASGELSCYENRATE
jgi:hypothetical protein